MICTCTLNPSLDYYMEFDKPIEDGKTNRASLEYYEAGGKGINISIVLSNLGIPSRAFGFLGGFTKDFYISLLTKYQDIRPSFTYIDGNTRINVKCTGDKDTNMNACGPHIQDKDLDNLSMKLKTLYENDVFVLAGNTPEYTIDHVVEILHQLQQEGVKVVLDTDTTIVKKMLETDIFLLKLTKEECEEVVGYPVQSKLDMAKAANELHQKNIENVIILDSEGPAVLASNEGVFECGVLDPKKTVNTVGTGDSMVAGFLMEYNRTRNVVDSFRFGASCGSATAYSKGMATREKIESLYHLVEVQKIA